MNNTQKNDHLHAKVMTASPAKLHLMLIEGAVRFCMKAQQDLEDNNEGYANEAMVRAIDIVGEMLAGVRHSDDEVNKKLSDLYLFLFQTLTSAYVNTDRTKLADVLRILEFERETWQLACEKVHAEETARQPVAKAPVVAPHIASSSSMPATGISLEA